MLTADSTAATGLAWAAAAAGKLGQVITATTTTQTTTTSTTYADATGFTVSITPSSTGSKILIIAAVPVLSTISTGTHSAALQLIRGASSIADFGRICGGYAAAETSDIGIGTLIYLDSPSTTSSTTYKVQVKTSTSSTAYVLRTGEQNLGTITVMEILP